MEKQCHCSMLELFTDNSLCRKPFIVLHYLRIHFNLPLRQSNSFISRCYMSLLKAQDLRTAGPSISLLEVGLHFQILVANDVRIPVVDGSREHERR